MNYSLMVLLAEEPTKTGPDFGKASPVGLLVVVLLLIAVFALVWSINRHLKKVPDNFAAQGTPPAVEAQTTVEGSGPAATREPSGEPGG